MQNIEDVQRIILERNWTVTGNEGNYKLYLAPFIGWDKIIARVDVRSPEDILKIYESGVMPKYGINDTVKVKLTYASRWNGSTHDCHDWVEGVVTGISVCGWNPVAYKYYAKYPKRDLGVHGRYTVSGRSVESYKNEDSIYLLDSGLGSINSEEPSPACLLRKDLMHKQIKKIPRYLDQVKVNNRAVQNNLYRTARQLVSKELALMKTKELLLKYSNNYLYYERLNKALAQIEASMKLVKEKGYRDRTLF